MLFIGQEHSRENTALAAEPCCGSDSNCSKHSMAPRGMREFLTHTTTPTGWPLLFTPSLLARRAPFRSRRKLPFQPRLARNPLRSGLSDFNISNDVGRVIGTWASFFCSFGHTFHVSADALVP